MASWAAMYRSNFGVRSRRMYEFRPAAAVRADAELVVAFRAADDDAIRSLVTRYGGLVYRIASAGSPVATAHETSAADLTVHTFLQAWRNAEVFEPGREFGPWLANLAVRVVGAQDFGVTCRRAGARRRGTAGRPLVVDRPAGRRRRPCRGGDPGRGNRRAGRALHRCRPPCRAGVSKRQAPRLDRS